MRALVSFDLYSTFQLNMEWLMLQRPLAKWIFRGAQYDLSNFSLLFFSYLIVDI